MSATVFPATYLPAASRFTKAGVGLAALVAATGISALFWPDYSFSPFAPYYLAVLITAACGGATLGGVAIVLSIALVDYCFLPSQARGADPGFASMTPQALCSSVLFAASSATLVWLLELSRWREMESGKARERLVSVLESAKLAYWSSDAENGVAERSRRHGELFGLDGAQPGWALDTFIAHVHSDDRDRVRQNYLDAVNSNSEYAAEYRVIWPDGSVHWLQSLGRVSTGTAGISSYGVVMDIDQRKRSEAALVRQSFRQSLIASFGHKALLGVDLTELLDAAVSVVNDGLACGMSRVLKQRPDGSSFELESAGGMQAGWSGRSAQLGKERTAEAALATRAPVVIDDFRSELHFKPSDMLRASGVRSAAEVPVIGVSGAWGVLGAYSQTPGAFGSETLDFLESVANMLATVIDRRESDQRLAYLSQFDSLTGLPNRSLFLDRIQQVLAQARRDDTKVAVLFIDLDRFKVVNDTLGHAAGDELLRQVGQRLAQCVRSSDSIGRLGGDEFAMVLPQLNQHDDARLVAQKLTDALSEPFLFPGQTLYASASIGISIFPSDGEDPDELLRNADTAMYRAKDQGSGACQFYVPQMNERALERLRTETELRVALERLEFVLHYQPKVDLASGDISGFEALLRWQHPTRGLVPPLDFIGILEDTGLIVEVGEWVMREACRQITEWQAAGLPLRPIAVNLSARQFRQPDLDRRVATILAESNVPPGLLEFELTESLLMEDPKEAVRLMESIGASGVRLSVDDFGTGYSSLAYLKRFPLDALKIDRVFVRDVCSDENDATIALAIINLAHSLKLKVVAEGVETEAQIEFLREHGCDEIQGYFFARPSEASLCTRMLEEGRRLVTVTSPGQLSLH